MKNKILLIFISLFIANFCYSQDSLNTDLTNRIERVVSFIYNSKELGDYVKLFNKQGECRLYIYDTTITSPSMIMIDAILSFKYAKANKDKKKSISDSLDELYGQIIDCEPDNHIIMSTTNITSPNFLLYFSILDQDIMLAVVIGLTPYRIDDLRNVREKVICNMLIGPRLHYVLMFDRDNNIIKSFVGQAQP